MTHGRVSNYTTPSTTTPSSALERFDDRFDGILRIAQEHVGVLVIEQRILHARVSCIADRTLGNIFPSLPDEKFRRVGQSAAAASLPELK